MSEKHKKILKKVLTELNKKRPTLQFICNNVQNQYENSTEHNQITNWISSALSRRFSYTTWLYENHLEFYKKHVKNYRGVEDEYKLKQGRIQWLKWMIKNHHVFDNVKV